MFRRPAHYVKSNNAEVDLFIEGQDYCNSELLYKLDQVKEYSEFLITKHEHRADLITEDIYNSTAYTKYSWIIMYFNRITVDELKRGRIIKYIPLDKLIELINSI